MALSKPCLLLAAGASVAQPALAYQQLSRSLRSTSLETNLNRQAAAEGSRGTSLFEIKSDATSQASLGATIAATGTCAAAVALMRQSTRHSGRTTLHGLKSSPGFNTLPDFGRVKTGFDGYVGVQDPVGFWDPLTLCSAEERKTKLNAELANGRLAMMAIIGMFFQDGLTGSAWGSWSLYTDSPLRAFESELGVQSPVGFWDPIGFAADGDVQAFRRRRTVELKHGRIAMLACMGYITPEITGKFPGYLSPSMDLKFSDIPNGIDALTVVPPLGWAQIILFMGVVDVLGGFSDYKTGTPGDYGWKLLTSDDDEEKEYKLQAELANGRLAMVAIMAMLFQNGVTGTTGSEMWLASNNAWTP